MKIHELYINRCLQLAENGLGRTYPNPMVGSVVVHKGKIIGEGWHPKAGEAHAEVNAINSVKDKGLLGSSTIYVSLEPCSHYGKTPPCSDLIIASGIKKVVIGTIDPFSKVAGRGIQKLIKAGCKVMVGILEKECQELNNRFFTFIKKERPFIILKWAESADGFISPGTSAENERIPVWISNAYSQQLVHKWRSEEQAILVGTNTAVADNPSLTTRKWHGPDPVRIAVDRQGRIPGNSALFDGKARTIVISEADPSAFPSAKGLEITRVDFGGNLPHGICERLYSMGIQSLIIEGGRQTLQSFIKEDLWDEARIFTGKLRLGKGVPAPEFSGTLISEASILSDNLKIYRNDQNHYI